MKFFTQIFILALICCPLSAVEWDHDDLTCSYDYTFESNHFISNPLALTQAQQGPINKNDFFLVSIPKSGTHLMAKLLIMLSFRNPRYIGNLTRFRDFEQEFARCKSINSFVYHHTGNFLARKIEGKVVDTGTALANFSKTVPEYVKILQIRDLRDIFVSLVHYLDKRALGMWKRYGIPDDASFDEKLTVAIEQILEDDIKNVVLWLDDPTVYIVKFEDVVGPQGGGNAAKQNEVIVNIANLIGVELTNDRLTEITNNLFGTSKGPRVAATFHKGKIGAWKEYYKPEHKKLFNDLWGSYQQTLGYPLAE